MSSPASATILLLLLSGLAGATCVVTPLQEQLHSADSVFVATLTDATIAESPDSLKDRGLYHINYSFVVRERLKGDPTLTRSIYVHGRYDDSGDGRTMHWAEQTRLVPGESVLVLASGAGDVQVGLCSPSRKLDERELGAVRSALAL